MMKEIDATGRVTPEAAKIINDLPKAAIKGRTDFRHGIPDEEDIEDDYISPASVAHRKAGDYPVDTPAANRAWIPTAPQVKLAMALVSPDLSGKSNHSRAIALGIPSRSFYNWMHDKRFVKFVHSLVPLATDQAVPEVWNALMREARSGSVNAIALFFKMKGLLPKETTVNQSISIEAEIVSLGENSKIDEQKVAIALLEKGDNTHSDHIQSIEAEVSDTDQEETSTTPQDYMEMLSPEDLEDLEDLHEEMGLGNGKVDSF